MVIEKSETEIQREILDYLKLRNIPVNRNNAGKIKIGSRYINLGKSGWPDIIAVHKGFLGIEVKKPGEDLSDKQKEVKQNIERAGGMVIKISSIEELAKRLLTL